MMKELEYPFESKYILRKKKTLKKLLLENQKNFRKLRIAVLGGSTTTDIIAVLELFLLNAGILPQFYESEYGKFWEDAVFGNDALDSFCPEVVFIHTSFRNIINLPTVLDTEDQVQCKLDEEFERLRTAWESLRERYNCVIIQNNFERPLLETLGNQDVSDFRGWANFTGRLNQKLYKYKQQTPNFLIHDLEGISGEYGLRKWQDLRYWYLYKYTLHMEAIPEFSYHLFTIIKSIYGKNKKLLILDADNTLWGGVIGDCGPEGIELGEETSKGQAFKEWQKYVKRLKQQGILLALASKNQTESVESGLAHPDSQLKIDDFSAKQVNWEDKASNIFSIISELNLGTDQAVFLDDNPVEREQVRINLPEVTVPDVSCPEQFIAYLREAHLFEITTITEEDIKRTEMYRANQQREAQKQQFGNYEEYLKSLEMKAEIQEFSSLYYDRIAQLINKTNQFNLTTWRITEEEVKKLAGDENWICITGRLRDKFGDNGIVSVLMAELKGHTAHIQLLILSCRVFKRHMEYAMIDDFICRCKERAIDEIIGYYYPTEKNRIVETFYKDLGFMMDSENIKTQTAWKLKVEEYKKRNFVIDLEEKDE
jgi:FkbH-like protein